MNSLISTPLKHFKIRFANQSDVLLILNFIQALADYEKMSDDVVATEESLMTSLFIHKQAEVIILPDIKSRFFIFMILIFWGKNKKKTDS